MFSFHVCSRLLKRKRQVQLELLLQIKWENISRWRHYKDQSGFFVSKNQCCAHDLMYRNSSCLYPTIITGPWKWWALHIDGGRHHSARSCYTRRLHTWEERVSTTPNICSYIVWIDIYCRYIIYNIHVNTNIERAVLSSECLPIQVFSIY